MLFTQFQQALEWLSYSSSYFFHDQMTDATRVDQVAASSQELCGQPRPVLGGCFDVGFQRSTSLPHIGSYKCGQGGVAPQHRVPSHFVFCVGSLPNPSLYVSSLIIASSERLGATRADIFLCCLLIALGSSAASVAPTLRLAVAPVVPWLCGCGCVAVVVTVVVVVVVWL